MRTLLALLALAACPAAELSAPLGDFEVWSEGWVLGLGPEFPGAKGGLDIAGQAKVGKGCLNLSVDFAGGGGYVQIARRFPEGLPLQAVSGWLKSDGVAEIRYRLVDSTGQVFQSPYLQVKGGPWTRFTHTVAELTKAEHWEGAKDGKWQGPCRSIAIMVPKGKLAANRSAASIAFDDLEAVLEPGAAKPAPEGQAKLVLLDNLDGGAELWSFTNGPEFPGATGAMSPEGKGGKSKGCLRLDADFTGGGSYVAVHRKLPENGPDVREVRFWLKRTGVDNIGLRLIDNSGQCHQKRGGIWLKPGDGWQEISVQLDEVVGGEHWGGANDGAWHPPLAGVSVMVGGNMSGGQKSTLWIDELRGVAITDRKR